MKIGRSRGSAAEVCGQAFLHQAFREAFKGRGKLASIGDLGAWSGLDQKQTSTRGASKGR
ncbi:hypothetical protein BDS110ZK4_47910 [Bradyrhizobium diazoefficiens]